MAIEFTGERVVPGQVDVDLWNEHFARYAFTSRLAKRKRVLDLGCGTGYGTRELSRQASVCFGLDQAFDAVAHARANYAEPSLHFVCSSCLGVPFPDASFELVVCFEVIEHVEQWRDLLGEARRVLAPGGQFVISTPNKLYYAESRQSSGPNPYHHHEFEFEEFCSVLGEIFPHVRLFVENHADAIIFRPVSAEDGQLHFSGATEIRAEPGAGQAGEAHFFLAVCALSPQTGAPTYLYLPASANVLRERELHIARLERELTTKNAWLESALQEHQALVELHRQQTADLEKRSAWAQELDAGLRSANQRIVDLQDELDREQKAGQEVVAGYEQALATLEANLEEHRRGAQEIRTRLEAELAAQCDAHDARAKELAACVELLHAAEETVEQRTNWALALQSEIDALKQHLHAAGTSRWMRLGRSLGLGPELRNL